MSSEVLMRSALFSEGLIDPWGNKYVMRVPSQPAEEGEFYIVSAGPDGKMGSEDDIVETGFVVVPLRRERR